MHMMACIYMEDIVFAHLIKLIFQDIIRYQKQPCVVNYLKNVPKNLVYIMYKCVMMDKSIDRHFKRLHFSTKLDRQPLAMAMRIVRM